jgi:hypothetical protein
LRKYAWLSLYSHRRACFHLGASISGYATLVDPVAKYVLLVPIGLGRRVDFLRDQKTLLSLVGATLQHPVQNARAFGLELAQKVNIA